MYHSCVKGPLCRCPWKDIGGALTRLAIEQRRQYPVAGELTSAPDPAPFRGGSGLRRDDYRMERTACPECEEYKRVSISVPPLTERRPKPVYRFHCRTCDYSWVVDLNEDPGVKGKG